jgi:hypothetical protein
MFLFFMKQSSWNVLRSDKITFPLALKEDLLTLE